MTGRYCDECLMPHDACDKCGAAVVASVRLHINMNAHGNGKHFCGADNPGYQAMLRAMREGFDDDREMLSDCRDCGVECVRRANSPVLYDVHGYYGLLGDTAVHNCAQVVPETVQAKPVAAPAMPQEQPSATPRLRLL